jgi:hypothetical protein
MEPVTRYYVEALQLTAEQFAAQHPHPFLLKRPTGPISAQPPAGYSTFSDGPTLLRDDDLAPALDPTSDWYVTAVRKGPQGSPGERLTVGRQRDCDVLLPFEPVSKVHAYILPGDGGPLQLIDALSSNGTYVNDRALPPNRPVKLQPGDKVRFGPIECEYLSPEGFYMFLRTR